MVERISRSSYHTRAYYPGVAYKDSVGLGCLIAALVLPLEVVAEVELQVRTKRFPQDITRPDYLGSCD